MRTRRHDRTTHEEHEVNMTPLIDVSLVLVVILLLATPLAFESSIAVRREAETAKAAAVPDPAERIEVRVIDEETVRLNSETMHTRDLAASLEPLLAASLPKRVLVKCDDRVSHGAFVGTLDVVKQAGARDIAVMGRKR